jgi:hypothetical protein
VKLAATVLAALSLVGCATDNDGEGGAYLVGMRPAKPSLDDAKPILPQANAALTHLYNGGLAWDIRGGEGGTNDVLISAEDISVPFPIEGLCKVCDTGVIALRDPRNPSELTIVDELGNQFCKIWVTPGGEIETTDCR